MRLIRSPCALVSTVLCVSASAVGTDLGGEAQSFFNTTWGNIAWPSMPGVVTLDKQTSLTNPLPNLQRMLYADGIDLRQRLQNGGFKWKGWDLDGKGTDVMMYGNQGIAPWDPTVYHVREVPSVDTPEEWLAYRAAWVFERIDPSWSPDSATPPPVLSAVAGYVAHQNHDDDCDGFATSHRVAGAWASPFALARNDAMQTNYSDDISISTRLISVDAAQPQTQSLWISIGEPSEIRIWHVQMAEFFDGQWLPVMDDYVVGVPEPATLPVALGALLVLRRRGTR